MDKKNTNLNFYCMVMAFMVINNYSCYLNDLDEVDYETGNYLYYGLFKAKLGGLVRNAPENETAEDRDKEVKKMEDAFLKNAKTLTGITTIATG